MLRPRGEGSSIGQKLAQKQEAYPLWMQLAPRIPSPPLARSHIHHHALLDANFARRGYPLPVLPVTVLPRDCIFAARARAARITSAECQRQYRTWRQALPCLSTLNERQLCTALLIK
jgi:hypothetical protein